MICIHVIWYVYCTYQCLVMMAFDQLNFLTVNPHSYKTGPRHTCAAPMLILPFNTIVWQSIATSLVDV